MIDKLTGEDTVLGQTAKRESGTRLGTGDSQALVLRHQHGANVMMCFASIIMWGRNSKRKEIARRPG